MEKGRLFGPGRSMAVWVSIALLLACLSCFDGGGFVSPSDSRNLESLGTVVGRADYGSDTTPSTRFLKLVNPKVSMMWRSVGYQEQQFSDNHGSVSATPPFTFTLNLLKPPPPGVHSADLSFGILFLYSDADGNGRFDRFMHPGLREELAGLDSLSRVAEALRSRFRQIAREILPRQAWAERFHLGADGTLARIREGKSDTLWRIPASMGAAQVTRYLGSYHRLLGNRNRWERFFSNRKKTNEYGLKEFTVPGIYKGLEVSFDRALYPLPGREAEFDSLLVSATEALASLSWSAEAYESKARQSGRLDYPFDGYSIPGEDWMAGRARLDFLVYVAGERTVDTLIEAIRTSTFRFSNAERFRPGYNPIRCDDQYRCRILDQDDSLLIYLGTSDAYFSPPSGPATNPFLHAEDPVFPEPRRDGGPVPPADVLSGVQGRYAFNGGDTVVLAIRDGECWYLGPGSGLIRVLPVDSAGFRAQFTDLQGLMVRDPGREVPDRLIEYASGKRASYLRVSGTVGEELLQRIDSASGFARADFPDSLMTACEGAFDHSGDTLRVVWTGGDSLIVGMPGLPGRIYHATGAYDGIPRFRCPWADWRLSFEGFRDGAFSRAVVGEKGTEISVPAFLPAPSNGPVAVQEALAGMDWMAVHQGSGPDDYPSPSGRGRYSCSEDNRFLRPGDGHLESFRRARESDSISLRQGGDEARFRLTGLERRHAVLQLRSCAEMHVRQNRIRISVWGGGSPETQDLLFGDHHWLTSDTAGSYWLLDSIPITADPFYLTLRQENTADPKFHNAWDAYWLGVHP